VAEDKRELSWAAGLYDGEGCTTVAKDRNSRWQSIMVCMSQKHPGVLRRFMRATEPAAINGPYRSGMYSVQYRGPKALRVLEKLWPYLSAVKAIQALTSLDRVNDGRRENPLLTKAQRKWGNQYGTRHPG
jgi:hypothetical protein